MKSILHKVVNRFCVYAIDQGLSKVALHIMKVYFKNEKKPICVEIYYICEFYFYS
jgi:hypothetical protein